MRRLKKILALSESSSPGEAAAAIQQAQKLMAKYDITQEGVAMSEITQTHVSAKSVELQGWEGALSSVVARAMGCAVIVATFKRMPGSMGIARPKANIQFAGTAVQTRIAAYAYTHLRKQLLDDLKHVFDDALVKAGYKIAKKGSRASASERQSFAFGWAAAVEQKVKNISPAPAMLDKFVHAATNGADPISFKKNTKLRSGNTQSFTKIGFAMGQSADLNKGVDVTGSNLKLVQNYGENT